jgi:hypothetical protein
MPGGLFFGWNASSRQRITDPDGLLASAVSSMQNWPASLAGFFPA